MSMPLQELDIAAHQIRAHTQSQPEWGKRLFDIAAAAFGLMLLFPVMLVTVMLIKREDPAGPVFFSQTRVGKNGRMFKMYKFRSMVANAETLLNELIDCNESSGAMFKMKDDPRVTKVGKWIRKTSVDEFPQLWNVLKGDMSIVGPRPPLVREVAMYTESDFARLSVLPGCTGLWQVSGRSSIGFEEMVELDLQYIRNRSFWFDVIIIFRTVKMLIGSTNAY